MKHFLIAYVLSMPTLLCAMDDACNQVTAKQKQIMQWAIAADLNDTRPEGSPWVPTPMRCRQMDTKDSQMSIVNAHTGTYEFDGKTYTVNLTTQKVIRVIPNMVNT